MYRSHEGLINGYEVNFKELDFLVDIASLLDGVIGARMMGGGFGGCTINLVSEDKIENFKKVATAKYSEKFGIEPKFYVSEIVGGTGRINN